MEINFKMDFICRLNNKSWLYVISHACNVKYVGNCLVITDHNNINESYELYKLKEILFLAKNLLVYQNFKNY